MSSRYTIARLGAQGDGIAPVEGGQVFVPFTLPGETVTASRVKERAELISVLEPALNRVAPACRHFTVCGGCALQHMAMDDYLAWKRDKVIQALRQQSIEIDVDPIVSCAPASRRRAVFSARKSGDAAILGYYRAFSHDIVDIDECPIAAPAIENSLPMLRRLSGILANMPDPFHLTVTDTLSGLDVAVTDVKEVSIRGRAALTGFATTNGLARLTVNGEIIIEPNKPQVTFGQTLVAPPPGGFLQAVISTEQSMAELVLSHLAKSRKLADLFAGSGTFALRLAKLAEVHAVEGDAASLASLDRAFRMGSGLKRVTHEKRDLFRRPIMFKELNAFDGLVFDPPRSGAEDQCKHIAKSDVPKVVAVSCNPTTLARDLSILIAGGYQLKRVVPLDQFLWSPHVEAVALLEKPRKRR